MENKKLTTECNVNGRVMYKLNERWKSKRGVPFIPLSNFALFLARLLPKEKRLREDFHLVADSLRGKFAV